MVRVRRLQALLPSPRILTMVEEHRQDRKGRGGSLRDPLRRKKKKQAVVIATFGNHFSMNDAIEKFRKEGLQFETEKGHIVKIYLDKNTKERAEQVRSIIREHLGYVEPL